MNSWTLLPSQNDKSHLRPAFLVDPLPGTYKRETNFLVETRNSESLEQLFDWTYQDELMIHLSLAIQEKGILFDVPFFCKKLIINTQLRRWK